MKFLSLLLPLCAVSTCERPTSRETAEAKECPELTQFDPATAATDGMRVAASEPYLLGVYGFTIEVPGQVRDDLPVRMIERTSDFECEELNARAREYARGFNEAVQAQTVR